MSDLLCDICHDPDPVWQYPATSFLCNLIEEADESPIGLASHGDWALCERCSTYLESDQNVELAIVAADALYADIPDADYEWILASMVKLHAQFRANRIGPCRPIEERISA